MAKDEKTRSRIVEKARAKFFREGLSRVTMDEIAAELKISKKTIYAQFPSKHALVEAVMFVTVEGAQLKLQAILGAKASYEEKFAQVMTVVQETLRPMSPAYLKDFGAMEPELFEMIRARRARLVGKIFATLIEQGRREGKIKSALPTEMVVKMLVGILDAIIVPNKLVELGLRPEEGILMISRMILKGLL